MRAIFYPILNKTDVFQDWMGTYIESPWKSVTHNPMQTKKTKKKNNKNTKTLPDPLLAPQHYDEHTLLVRTKQFHRKRLSKTTKFNIE